MGVRWLFGVLICTSLLVQVGCKKQQDVFTVHLDVSKDIQNEMAGEGRLFLFLSKNFEVEPRMETWPNPNKRTYIFAQNLSDFDPAKGFEIRNGSEWLGTADWNLDAIPKGEYKLQVLWDQDTAESRIDAPGNLYSDSVMVTLDGPFEIDLTLDRKIGPRSILEHPLAKEVVMESKVLSDWWGKPVTLKASVLLPHAYDAAKAYPIRYNVSGYGGRYTRINRFLGNQELMEWWDSEEAPQVITVYLDGEGPFGDCYQMDSDNSGPYGEALITELAPYIEKLYRGTDTATTRFVDGCSTGGWVSLGLQLYYPDFFNGVFSYSPDAVEFENYQLINVYQDENAFVNEFGYLRPVARNTDGEPILSLKDFIRYENVLGPSNSYLNSGGQFSAHAALYGPKGENGLPKPLFDPETGKIDHTVAEYWKKYDFKIHAKENWASLGPKLQGKIFIWMGDMDNFYLNPATRAFAQFLEETSNPRSDAKIVFSPMDGHCWQFSDKRVLEQIAERLGTIGHGK